MNKHHTILFLLLSATLFCGCSQSQPVSEAQRSGGLFSKFIPADKTTKVGTAVIVSPRDGYAIIERNRAPLDAGAFLVAQDAGHNPTAVLEASLYSGSSYPSQGVKIISGQLQEGYEVVDPGPELAQFVQHHIDQYVASLSNLAGPTTETAAHAPTQSTSPAL